MMKAIFWFSAGIILYTYFGYPYLLILISKLRPRGVKKVDINPTVTVIIAAYNEEESIRAKIENSLSLDYPRDKLEIMVASDCSTDKTDDIVRQYASYGVLLDRHLMRRGKTAAQNAAALKAKGEILVFTDATTKCKSDAARKLIRNFADVSVGCVGGHVTFVRHSDRSFGREKGTLARFEQFVREKESLFNSIIAVSGCLYAVRRNLYESLDEEVVSDLAIPLKVIERGFRTVYEPEAISFEDAPASAAEEFRRKIRTVSQGWAALFIRKYNLTHLLNPFKYGFVSVQLATHKLLRWLGPIFLGIFLLSNIFILFFSPNILYGIIFGSQIVFYLCATMGFIMKDRIDKPMLFNVPFYFCMINISALLGAYKFVKGERVVMWETSY